MPIEDIVTSAARGYKILERRRYRVAADAFDGHCINARLSACSSLIIGARAKNILTFRANTAHLSVHKATMAAVVVCLISIGANIGSDQGREGYANMRQRSVSRSRTNEPHDQSSRWHMSHTQKTRLPKTVGRNIVESHKEDHVLARMSSSETKVRPTGRP